MANAMPHEVLCIIAQYLRQGTPIGKTTHRYQRSKPISLVPFALVSKAWQAAFEIEIWANLSIVSPSERTDVEVTGHESFPKKGLTLEQLGSCTSGTDYRRRARRAAMRQVRYKVAVPHWLADEREKDVDYTSDNPWRCENDEAFERGIRSLFECLSSWNEQPRALSLSIVLQAENVYPSQHMTEPGTSIGDGSEEKVPPYLAQLSDDCQIPHVSCIYSIKCPRATAPAHMGSENGIRPSTALKIASACTGLQEINIDGSSIIPATEPEILFEQRDATARGLSELPKSVRSLELQWHHTQPLRDESDDPTVMYPCPTLDLQPDTLAVAVHHASRQLRKLNIQHYELSPDLFSPTDSKMPQWPRLEVLNLTWIPCCVTSTGEPVQHFRRPNEIFSESRSEQAMASVYELEYGVSFTYLDEVYEDLGHAARRMPQLKRLLLSWDDCGDQLRFSARDGRFVLAFQSEHEYKPSKKVLRAWGVREGELVVKKKGWLEAQFQRWPPSES